MINKIRYCIVGVFLFSTLLFSQEYSKKDATNYSETSLGANASFEGNSWKEVSNFNFITLAIKSNVGSATSGVLVKFAVKKANGVYVVVDSTVTSYIAGTVFSISLPITAPYLRVKYTNGSVAQSYFSLVTMLNVGAIQKEIAVSGGASVIKQYDKVTSTGGDSLITSGITDWWRFTISAIDDTIYYSNTYNYPADDKVTLLPGESYTTPRDLSWTYIKKLFFKTKGTGTPTVRVFWEGK